MTADQLSGCRPIKACMIMHACFGRSCMGNLLLFIPSYSCPCNIYIIVACGAGPGNDMWGCMCILGRKNTPVAK